MSQNFTAWKKTLDELISRRSAVPSLNLDQRKINSIQRIKALCTLQTKEVDSRDVHCIIPYKTDSIYVDQYAGWSIK